MIGCPSSSHRGSSSQETRTTGGSKKAWGGTGQPELKACRLALTLTSNLQEAGAQTPLGGAESPALAKPSVGQPLRGRRLRSSRGPELSEPLLPTLYQGRKVTRGPLPNHLTTPSHSAHHWDKRTKSTARTLERGPGSVLCSHVSMSGPGVYRSVLAGEEF